MTAQDIPLNDPALHTEDQARAYFEAMRWPGGPTCPNCGVVSEGITTVVHSGKRTKPVPEGKKHRPARAGLYYCKNCDSQFTVRVGTILEKSHIPLNKWQYAFRKMCGSKKGISAHQLHRELKLSYKSAWFLAHRIREAMRSGSLAPIGGTGRIAEVDETVIGRKQGVPKASKGSAHKNIVLTLVERGGAARSFHVDQASAGSVIPVVRANLNKETAIVTDEASYYHHLDVGFAGHETVNHGAKEWGRGEIHTNTVEGYFSIFKRGMKGIYQHCSEKHLHRYLSEFDFRYSNRVRLGVDDAERTDRAVRQIEGRRLTYRRIGGPRQTPASETPPPF